MNVLVPSSPHSLPHPHTSPSDHEESKQEKYSTAEHLADEKKKQKKEKSNLIKPFIKAAKMFDEALLKNSESLLKSMNPNSFWYIVNAQYFPDSHLGHMEIEKAHSKSIKDLNNAMKKIPGKTRFPGKRESTQQDKAQWRNEYLKELAEGLIPWMYNFVHFQKRCFKAENQSVEQDKCQKGEGQITSLTEDYHFVGSTVAIVTKYLKRKMDTSSNFRSAIEIYVNEYKQNHPFPAATRIKTNKRYQLEQITDEFGTHCNLVQYEDEDDHDERQIHLTTSLILRSIALSLPLDLVQTILEDMIQHKGLQTLKEKSRKYIYTESEDIANFVGTHHKLDDQWFEWLKGHNKIKQASSSAYKNEAGMSSKRRFPTKEQDIICHICYSGQYQEHNLIVICALCNIAVHQNCAYLDQIPQDNWICRVCETFGKEGANLPCYLCPIRGGAMLPSQLRAAYFECNNEEYSIYLKTNKPLKKPSLPFPTEGMRKNTVEFPQLYNYLEKDTYTTEKPKLFNVWVHFNCVQILDECFYSQVEGQAWAEGLDTIKKCKFNSRTCEICQSSQGVVAVCKDERCQKGFHAECARRIKMVSEQHVEDVVYYQVFCPDHRPLQIQQKVLMRRRKARADIRKLAANILKILGPDKTNIKLPHLSSTIQTHKRSPIYHEPMIVAKKRTKKAAELQEQDQMAIDYKQREFYNAVFVKLKQSFLHFQDIKKDGMAITAYDALMHTLNNQTSFWKQFYQPRHQSFMHFQKLRKNCSIVKKKVLSFQVKIKQLSDKVKNTEEQDCEDSSPQLKSRKNHRKSVNQGKDNKLEVSVQRRRSSRNKVIVEVNTPTNQRISSVIVQFQDPKEFQKGDQQERTAKSRQPEEQVADFAEPAVKKQEHDNKWYLNAPKKQFPGRRRSYNSHTKIQNTDSLLMKVKVQEDPQIKWANQQKQEMTKSKRIKKKEPFDPSKMRKSHKNQEQKDQVSQPKRASYRGVTTRAVQTLYCLCQQPYDEDDNRKMICCNKCEEWYHFDCIGFMGGIKRAVKLDFICQKCVVKLNKVERLKHLNEYQQIFKKSSSIVKVFSENYSGARSLSREL